MNKFQSKKSFIGLKLKLILAIVVVMIFATVLLIVYWTQQSAVIQSDPDQSDLRYLLPILVRDMIVFCIIVGLIFLFFRKHIDRPLKALAKKMALVQMGHMEGPADILINDDLGILTDGFNRMVNRLRQAEKEIRAHHQEQLERVDRMANLGEMAAGLAHEINNPTGIILTRIGYLLHSSKKEKFSYSVIRDLESIQDLTLRISSIVKGLLHFSKATTSNPYQFHLTEVLDKLLLMMEPRLGNQKIRLYKNLKSKSAFIFADPLRIEQVILNVVNNAIDAMPNGGNLIVLTDRPDGRRNGDFIRLCIRDTGLGIKADHLEKIFHPFFTTKDESKGTGLGLAISYEIIKKHGGLIEVHSEIGKGSEFNIFFPISTN